MIAKLEVNPPEVVGVDRRTPARMRQGGLGRHARVLVPAAVEVVDRAVGSGRPDDVGHGVGQLAGLPLALAQGLIGPPSLGDVGEEAQGPHESTVRIQERAGRGVEPDFAAVLPAEADFRLILLAAPPRDPSLISLGLILGEHEIPGGPTHDLLGPVAERLGQLGVDECRPLLAIDGPDALIRRFDDAPV